MGGDRPRIRAREFRRKLESHTQGGVDDRLEIRQDRVAGRRQDRFMKGDVGLDTGFQIHIVTTFEQCDFHCVEGSLDAGKIRTGCASGR